MKYNIIFIGGPTGSGKSTLIRKFKTNKNYPVYLEKVNENQYFIDSISGKKVDFYNSQQWFNNQIIEAIKTNPSENLIVEQHPEGISKVYGKVLLYNELISKHEYQEICKKSEEIYSLIESIGFNYLIVNLDAHYEVLLKRIEQRKSDYDIDEDFVKLIAEKFRHISFNGPSIQLNSDFYSVEQIYEKILNELL